MSDKTFRLGDWEIVETKGVEAIGIYVRHLDCHPGDNLEPFDDSWIISDLLSRCYYCKMTVPDEIQALMILRTGSI